MSEPAIRVRELSYRYGPVKALEQLGFELPAATFLALLGPNGAGKSTLFALLTRLLRSPPGAIELFGTPLERDPRAALARIGVVFQASTLDPDLSVAQNLAYHASLHGMSAHAARRRIEEELARFELQETAARRVRSLNGGHRRRVEIARALLHRPRLLLLDEPTVGLDVATRTLLITHVRRLCAEQGIAVLWATHIIEELAADDAVLMLHQGRIRTAGVCRELVRDSACASMSALLLQLTGTAA